MNHEWADDMQIENNRKRRDDLDVMTEMTQGDVAIGRPKTKFYSRCLGSLQIKSYDGSYSCETISQEI